MRFDLTDLKLFCDVVDMGSLEKVRSYKKAAKAAAKAKAKASP